MNDHVSEQVLAHYGVKGMKWGIRKEYERSSSDRSNKSVSKTIDEKSLNDGLRAAIALEAEKQRLKYGPGSQSESGKSGLSDTQKKVLIGAAAGIGIAGLAYLGYRTNQNLKVRQAIAVGGIEELLAKEPGLASAYDKIVAETLRSVKVDSEHSYFFKKYLFEQKPTTAEMVEAVGEVNLRPGHILKRISTEAETSLKPTGFYCAYEEADVTRYKAAIPAFWRIWGFGKDTGHVVSISADAGLKAPSGKETLALWREFRLSRRGVATPDLSVDAFIRESVDWVSPGHSDNVLFFRFIQSKGYNALVDFNDLGRLGSSPIRTLTSNGFSISGTSILGIDEIKAARDAALSLIHFFIQNTIFGFISHDKKGLTMDVSENVLEHFGVKGMRWGVRRDNRANNLVSVGKGAKKGRARAAASYTPLDALRGRGLKEASAIRGQRQLDRNKRVREGEASVKDKLAYYGGTRQQDIIPTGRSRASTSAALGASAAGALIVAYGASTVTQLAMKAVTK